MFERLALVERVEKSLHGEGFSTCRFRGCFDIAAKRRKLLFIKILQNIDSFDENDARSMKTLSNNLEAAVLLVGFRTRRERLKDDIVYERYDIPAVTVKTLERALAGESPGMYRTKGGLLVEVDKDKLREMRQKAGMTQQELADAVGVTKKNIYEHEARSARSAYSVAASMERVLKKKITEPVDLWAIEMPEAETKPSDRFEERVGKEMRHIGFNTKFVYHMPFNIIAKERILILSDAEREPKHTEELARLSKLTKKPSLLISDSGQAKTGEMPVITPGELKEMHTTRDLIKVIKNW